MYELVIGLEVHIQPKTKSKMFCGCSANYFAKQPNTYTCPVCLGLPGALPVPNKEGIKKCIKLGLALNCKIHKDSKFDRKHYFYPDLAKGYQISQFDLPFCFEGFLEVDSAKDGNRIRIARIHMEEDTAKSMHVDSDTLIDFNKSGVPLIELVTEPDFRTVDEVLIFAKRLRQIVRYLEISDADMEKGQMRFELNMSLKPSGQKGLPKYKVEVKNISSISVLEKVIAYEFERQKKILESGRTPLQETRGLRDLSGKTYGQRQKEDAEDYRYFPEPDIPPIRLDEDFIKSIQNELVELPLAKKYRFIESYKLEPDTAEKLVANKTRAKWFEEGIRTEKDLTVIKLFSNWFVRDVLGYLKVESIKLKDLKFDGKDLLELVAYVKNGKLSGNLAKQVLEDMFKTGNKPKDIIKKKGLEVVTDKDEIIKFINQVIRENSKLIENIDKNPNAIKFLMGQVMRLSKGKADPKIVMELLETKIKN